MGDRWKGIRKSSHRGLGLIKQEYMPSIAFVENASENDSEAKGVNSRSSGSQHLMPLRLGAHAQRGGEK